MNGQELVTVNQGGAIDLEAAGFTIGGAANSAAAAAAFAEYREGKSANTLRTHDAALNDFAGYLRRLVARLDQALNDLNGQAATVAAEAAAWRDITGARLSDDPQAWKGITWGILRGYKRDLSTRGYAIATINARLSAVRIYVELAAAAGAIPVDELPLFKTVTGYGMKEGLEVDRKRATVRKGAKKAAPVKLTALQVSQLKRPITPTGQGLRDAFMMTLLLDHGLRIGELAGLTVEALDLEAGLLTFYRPKTEEWATHRLTADTMIAARRYLEARPATAGPGLWVASNRRGRLLPGPISERALAKRVKLLGELVDARGLSPHDLRHNWTDAALAGGTSDHALMDAGNWKSRSMIDRYRSRRAVANEGVNLRR